MANIKYAGMEAVSRIADYVNAKLTFVSTMPESPDINTVVLYVGADTSAYKQGGVYKYDGTDWVLINLVKAIELTQEEYDALPLAVQCNGTIYFVTNAHVEGSIVTGYYNSADGKFYVESTFETPMANNVNVIYIDAPTNITYIYDLTNDEYVQVGGGRGGTVIEYVNSLPVSGIQDIIYGYDSVTTYNETVAHDFLDNDDNFVKTDENDDYTYTAAAGINIEASVDGITYKGFSSLAFDHSNEEFILTYSDTTTATLQLTETFYWKISARNYYAGNADEQSLTLLAGSSGGSGTSYVAGNAINITGNVISGDYKAGDGIAINGDEISTTDFVGTQAEWDTLPAEDKVKYDFIHITDDTSSIVYKPGHSISDGTSEKTQREVLEFTGFTVTDDSINGKTKIAEVPYTAGDGIDITDKEISISDDIVTTFNGTRAEWDALSAADKAKYAIVNLTDEAASGEMIVVDIVQDGNMNPVTSNATYDAINALKGNQFGTRVDISAYNSASNKYTCPSDGYITINSGEATSGYGAFALFGNNDSNPGLTQSFNATTAYAGISIYVKKGMKTFAQSLPTNFRYYFIPIE